MSKRTKARDYKTLRGFFNSSKRWIQHASVREDGARCCLIGAVGQICPNYSKQNPKFYEVSGKLEASIKKFYDKRKQKPSWISIVSFNDAPNRKFKDIRWVLEDAKV